MRRMRYARVWIVTLLGAASTAAAAPDEVYRCVDASGHARYTNIKKEAQARSCRRVTREVSVVPTAAIPALSPPASAGAANPATANAAGADPANTTAAKFPRVDAQTQKSRDLGRKRILQEELADEERSLAAARARFADAQARAPDGTGGTSVDRLLALREAVERHERNISALKRELGETK